MLKAYSPFQRPLASRYHVSLAVDDAEIAEAQRLFAEEQGTQLPQSEAGLDGDRYDRYCDHLLVRDRNSGDVVGTCRILTPEAAKRAGHYYSEQGFDLSGFHFMRPRMAELGRSCVHRDHRSGAVIARLWLGLADYMTRYSYDYVIGCASISISDGGHLAASVYRQLAQKHLSPVEWRATPRCRLPVEALDTGLPALHPPLIRAYTRLGAMVCSEPTWDSRSNTADLLMLLPMAQLNWAYARRLVA